MQSGFLRFYRNFLIAKMTKLLFQHHGISTIICGLQNGRGKDCATETDSNMIPIFEKAKALITDRTRAIVLVSPNNPSGSIYSNELLQNFYKLCSSTNIQLILDETYKDFHPNVSQPHKLLENNNWHQTLTILLFIF